MAVADGRNQRRFRKRKRRLPMPKTRGKGKFKSFVNSVKAIAKEASKDALEISRYIIPSITMNLANNKILDTTGPEYVDNNSWTIQIINEGIVSGTESGERTGNKIRVKGVQIHGWLRNDQAEGTKVTVRLMLIRMQRNIFEQANVNSPLPPDATEFPRLRDVEVLHDELFSLVAGTEASLKNYSFYKLLDKPAHYKAEGTGPDAEIPTKGVLYWCGYANATGGIVHEWSSQVTYHDELK